MRNARPPRDKMVREAGSGMSSGPMVKDTGDPMERVVEVRVIPVPAAITPSIVAKNGWVFRVPLQANEPTIGLITSKVVVPGLLLTFATFTVYVARRTSQVFAST